MLISASASNMRVTTHRAVIANGCLKRSSRLNVATVNDFLRVLTLASCLAFASAANAAVEKAVDVISRPGVTQRFLLIAPDNPKAVLILFAGGEGLLQINTGGGIGRMRGNFLVR